MTAGIKGTASETVTAQNTAAAMQSGALAVYATPSMIALAEQAAYKSIESELDADQGSVGTLMNISHIAATPVGMQVTAKTELISVDGRKLTFKVEVFDEKEKIGEGVHERFIIYNEKFQNKANSKLNN